MSVGVADGEYGRFRGDPDDRVVFGTYAREGTWSPELVGLLSGALCGKGGPGTLIDVGANIGLIAIPAVAGSGARALCFEPVPNNYRLLTDNVRAHGLEERIECFEVALSTAAGHGLMSVSPDNSGDHRLVDELPSERATVAVRTAALDAMLADRALTPPVVMKVDTQGAEARVLAGAPRTLARVDVLVCEYWPAGLARLGDRPEDLAACLTGFPLAAVLSQDGTRPTLRARADVLGGLAWVGDGDEGFFDLLLARQPLT